MRYPIIEAATAILTALISARLQTGRVPLACFDDAFNV